MITGGDTGRKGSMDIWSLGCCIVQMATGRRPWSTLENEWSVMYHVVTGHPPLPDASQLSSDGIDFLKKCFTRNPMKRPTAHELLSHQWIVRYLELYDNPEGHMDAGDYAGDYDGTSGVMEGTTDDPMASYNGSHGMDGGIDDSGMMRSIGSTRSYERPLVRSIANSMAIEGMANSLAYGEQAQAYFRDIAAQHAQDMEAYEQQQSSYQRSLSPINSARSVASDYENNDH